ncbi:MATE family efflux transporter, partial [bacterium]|nr:MATE family efflux transporter [bacterium]
MTTSDQPLPLLRGRWSSPGGYRSVLKLAIPLVLSTSSWSIQHFADRMFLSHYSTDSLAAAMPAGMLSFSIIAFFIGTASYATTFVAQYYGAGRHDRIGPTVWQAIYFSVACGLILPVFLPAFRMIFSITRHAPELTVLEVAYFDILMWGALFPIYSSALSSFFMGLGRNWPVMAVNVVMTIVNLLLDYALIFGNWGFPEMGIRGAALATVLAAAFGAIAFTVLVFTGRDAREFKTFPRRGFDREIFRRRLRYGTPSGLQFFLDVSAFT